MNKAFFPFILLLFYLPVQGQYVETILSHPELRDGLHVDSKGNIYTTSGGFAGFEVGKYDIETGRFNANFARGFFGPVDVDQYQDSLLIASNYDNNTLAAHNLNSRQHTILATGLDGPSGIAIDGQENIYVASWGNAPAYAGHQVHKITPSGHVSIYLDSPLLYRPQAMTTDLYDHLVLHSNEKIYRVNPADSILQLWINIGRTIGHMAFRQKDSCIYATSSNQVLKIRPDGSWEEFAGSTEGYLDGPIESAKFRGLLGIDFSPGEDTLYVCDSGYGNNIGRLRRIVMNEPVNTKELVANDISIFPNPASNRLIIHQDINRTVLLEILDVNGKRMITKSDRSQTIEIEIKQLPNGVYTLRASTDNGMVSKKFVKH